jgi:hypothetical protein
MSVTREDFFATRKLGFQAVPIPEMGKSVNVMVWNGAERDDWEFGYADWRKEINGGDENYAYYNAFLVAHSICDDERRRLFTSKEDIRRLNEDTSAVVLRKLALWSAKLNGVGAMELDVLAKNSDGDPSGSPGTDTPASGVSAP